MLTFAHCRSYLRSLSLLPSLTIALTFSALRSQVDLTPPICRRPTDQIGQLGAPPFFSQRYGYASSWQCYDPESGVVYTKWMPYASTALLSTAPSTAEIPPSTPFPHRYVVYADDEIRTWVPLLTRSVRMLSGEGYRSVVIPRYEDGARFFSCANSENGAELYVTDLCSEGTVYDGTPPVAAGNMLDELYGGRCDLLRAPSHALL